MGARRPLRESSDKGEAEPAVASARENPQTPMERFKSLAKRLARLTPEEIKEAQLRREDPHKSD